MARNTIAERPRITCPSPVGIAYMDGPGRWQRGWAPVKAPFSWPKSSLSMISDGIAAQSTVTKTQSNVLINGESGTGKELVARAIHYDSDHDIPLLANHFLEKMNQIEGKMIRGFEENVLDAFLAYGWPGNVRELENVVERAYVLCPTITIGQKYLPAKLLPLVREEREPFDQMNLLETEKRLIVKALNATSGNQSKAAEVLGISRKQLRTKMKNFGLLQQ